MSKRTNASARAAGRRFETSVAGFLAANVDDGIERRRLTGAKDRGDIAAVRHLGQRVAVECKDYGGRFLVGPWLAEVESERVNDGAGVGVVVAKRRGVSDPGEQVVFMTLRDLVSLMTGERP